MEPFFNYISTLAIQYPFIKTILYTLLMVIFFGVLKKILNTSINKKKISKPEKLILKKKATRYLIYGLFTCSFLLWFAQLQVFFVSLIAVAAAIVIALKELIMCLTGGILINISNIFKSGQRIEIDEYRGFVIEKNLLTTKILEIGPEKNSQQTTGDVISLPNSLMLSQGLKNESYFKGYSIKSFNFKIKDVDKLEDFEKRLLTLASDYCSGYLDDAKKNISKFCEKEGVIVPSLDPRTKLLVEDGEEFSVLLKLPVQNSDIPNIEQKLNRFYLDWRIQQQKKHGQFSEY